MSGQYMCAANNVEDVGYSNGLKISVNYKPICTAPTIQKKETGIDLICTVDSKPSANTYRCFMLETSSPF